MPPTEAERQAVGRLAAERCGSCGGKGIVAHVTGIGADGTDPCPDCLQDGKPTGRRWPGLVKQCFCSCHTSKTISPNHHCWHGAGGRYCIHCENTGIRGAVKPEAALWWLESQPEFWYVKNICSATSDPDCSYQAYWAGAVGFGPTPLAALAAAIAAKEEGDATT